MANEFKIRKGLIVHGSGSTGDNTIVDIQGNQGQLFSITDSLSGSLFSVNDISGIPILEVFSDDTINMGTFGAEGLIVSGSDVKLPNLSSQASEATALMITGSNVIGTRELGDNAFNSTAFTTCTGTVTSVGGTGNVSGISLSGTVTSTGNLTLGGTFSTTTSSITNFNTGVGTIVDGCGFVDTSGTPANNQIAIFTDADTVEGSSNLTFDGTNLTVGGEITSSLALLETNTTAFPLTISRPADNDTGLHIKNSVTDLYMWLDSGGGIGDDAFVITQGGFNRTNDATIILKNNHDVLVPNGALSASIFSGSFVGDGSGLTGMCQGTVTSVGGTGNVSGITLSGTVTSTGNLTLGGTFSTTTSSITNFNTGVGTIIGSCGFVDTSGTPSDNQIAIFTDADTVEGSSNLTFDGTNLTVGGRLTATEIVTNVVSQSISFATGSNRFGDEISDTHTFTGSLNVTGSLGVTGNLTISAGHIETDQIYLADKILHSGDSDTYIAFEDNTHRYFAAGEEMIKFNSSLITLNEAGGNNDIRIKGNSDNYLFYSDGSADKIGIGTITPDEKLTVEGNISGSGCLIIGSSHTNSGTLSSIAGGCDNTITSDGDKSFIGSGFDNCITGGYSTIVGGFGNFNAGCCSSIIGGCGNWVTGSSGCNVFKGRFSTVAGGSTNRICGGEFDFIGAGVYNTTFEGYDNGIVAGSTNCISGSAFGLIGSGQNNCLAGGYQGLAGFNSKSNVIAGGCRNLIQSTNYSSITAGAFNTITGGYSSIVGGRFNCISGECSFIGSGDSNEITANHSSIAGGTLNIGSGACSFIGGGTLNTASAACTFIGGGRNNSIDNQCRFGSVIVGGTCNNTTSGYYGPSFDNTFIGGGANNSIESFGYAFLGGGSNNTISGIYNNVLVGGQSNCNSGNYTVLVGGLCNTNSGYFSFLGGGCLNTNSGYGAFIGGGCKNLVTSNYSTIVGGILNTGSGACGFIGGGCSNHISASYYSTIVGGFNSTICECSNSSFVGGGRQNSIQPFSECSVLVGGSTNYIGLCSTDFSNSCFAFLGGGRANRICCDGENSIIVGGFQNTTRDAGSYIGGGLYNCITTTVPTADISNGTYIIFFDDNGDDVDTTIDEVLSCDPLTIVVDGTGYGPTAGCFVYGTFDVCFTNGVFNGINAGFEGTEILGATESGGCTTYTFDTNITGPVYIGEGYNKYQTNVIVGGCFNSITGTGRSFNFIGGGRHNCVCTSLSTIVGGCCNRIGSALCNPCQACNAGKFSFIGGGQCNLIGHLLSGACCNTMYNVITGGCCNSLGCLGEYSFIGGGLRNQLWSCMGTIAGGFCNRICYTMRCATIGGGATNIIGSYNGSLIQGGGVIAGGVSNCVCAQYSSVVGGLSHLIRTCCGYNFIGGGYNHSITGDYGYHTIAGGRQHTIDATGNENTISGGDFNCILCNIEKSTIGGGADNKICRTSGYDSGSTIAGGSFNCILESNYSVIGGGHCNLVISSSLSSIAGGTLNTASGACGFIGGGCLNKICSGEAFAVIGGGISNVLYGDYSFIGGGCSNYTTGDYAAIAGGQLNTGSASFTSIGGGIRNKATNSTSTIGGGRDNCNNSYAGVIGGGVFNTSTGLASSIVSGYCNCITGTTSGILGGCSNTVSHNCSFVVGSNLTSTAASTTYMNNATVACHLQVGGTTTLNTTTGRIDATNDIVAFATSDRRLKENIQPIENALCKVIGVSGNTFYWKPLTKEEIQTIHGNTGRDVGVIAQEIEEILPEAVTTRDNGYKAVNYEKIVPLLIEAIKEQQKQIDELKSKI